MEITENLKGLIEVGYSKHCEELNLVIQTRLNSSPIDIFDGYFEEERERVQDYCTNNNLDLFIVLKEDDIEVKSNIAYRLIEMDILILVRLKGSYDKDLKRLNITTQKTTNAIENCEWLAMFGSRDNLQWFSRDSKKLLEQCDKSHKWHEWTVAQVEAIKSNWIDPHDILPDVEKYQALMNKEVPTQVRELLTFPSGN